MQEVGLVYDLERIQQRRDDVVEFRLPRRALEALQPGLEAAALLEVEHHVGGVVGAEVAMHPHDVGVVETRQRLRFLDEAIKTPLIVARHFLRAWRGADALACRKVSRKILLDGDEPSQGLLVREVGDAEATGAQHTPYVVVADQLRPVRQGQQVRRWSWLGLHRLPFSGPPVGRKGEFPTWRSLLPRLCRAGTPARKAEGASLQALMWRNNGPSSSATGEPPQHWRHAQLAILPSFSALAVARFGNF